MRDAKTVAFPNLGVTYRSNGGVGGCGFLHKPTAAGRYENRLTAEYVVVYVIRGTGRFTDWLGRTHPLAPGCAIQMPPGRPHSVVHAPDGAWQECYLTLHGDFARQLIRFGSIDPSRPLLRPGLHESIVDRFAAIFHNLSDRHDSELPTTLALAHHLVVDLHTLDRTTRPEDPTAALIRSASLALSQSLDQRLDLVGLAARFDLSHERFRKIFRQRVGVSPGDYRIRRRIDRARALLAQHRMPNKEVARLLGYPDPFTFSKQFKRFTGQSPADFRRNS